MSVAEEVAILRRIAQKHTFELPEVDEVVYSNINTVSRGHLVWNLRGLRKIINGNVYEFSLKDLAAANLQLDTLEMNDWGETDLVKIDNRLAYSGVRGRRLSIVEKEELIKNGLVP